MQMTQRDIPQSVTIVSQQRMEDVYKRQLLVEATRLVRVIEENAVLFDTWRIEIVRGATQVSKRTAFSSITRTRRVASTRRC